IAFGKPDGLLKSGVVVTFLRTTLRPTGRGPADVVGTAIAGFLRTWLAPKPTPAPMLVAKNSRFVNSLLIESLLILVIVSSVRQKLAIRARFMDQIATL